MDVYEYAIDFDISLVSTIETDHAAIPYEPFTALLDVLEFGSFLPLELGFEGTRGRLDPRIVTDNKFIMRNFPMVVSVRNAELVTVFGPQIPLNSAELSASSNAIIGC